MAANFLHGVETIDIETGARPVSLVKTAVIALVGTAVKGAVNTLILVSRDTDFAQFGVDVENSTIVDALNNIFKQKGTVCLVVNVLDPAVHKTSIVDEDVTLSVAGLAQISHAAVAGVTVKNAAGSTTYVLGTDYTLNADTGAITRKAGGSIVASTAITATHLNVTYDYADPTKVTSADIIGGIDLAGKRSGLQLLKDSYQLFGFFPKLLISPVFASLNAVSTELISIANQLRAIAYIDAPAGITPQQAITGRGPVGGNFNVASRRAVLCYPHVKAYDATSNTEVLRPLSSFAAGLQSKVDQEKGYWWSASNQEISGITGMERPIYAMINDANSEANLLNEAGIVTLFNSFGTGIRLWGNRSAAFPSDTHPKNFINVQRVSDVVAESLEYFTLQFIDRPLDSALIDSIVESGNSFMRTLIANGAIIDGKVWFDKTKNEATELAAGHVTFSYDLMPPTPAERISYLAMVNINYLKQLGTSLTTSN